LTKGYANRLMNIKVILYLHNARRNSCSLEISGCPRNTWNYVKSVMRINCTQWKFTRSIGKIDMWHRLSQLQSTPVKQNTYHVRCVMSPIYRSPSSRDRILLIERPRNILAQTSLDVQSVSQLPIFRRFSFAKTDNPRVSSYMR
jgi:hypothetical protein